MMMNTNIEISRAVSMLRSVVRLEIESCVLAIDSGESDRARNEMREMRDKLKRVINVLNGLR